MNSRIASTIVAGVFAVVTGLQPLASQPEELHGADSVFMARGTAVLWGIYKGSNAGEALVYVKIALIGEAGGQYSFFSLVAANPFSGKSVYLARGEALDSQATVASKLSSFQEYPARRIRLYKTKRDMTADRPALIVFYQGIPDTTPEFLDEGKLNEYFAKALDKLRAQEAPR